VPAGLRAPVRRPWPVRVRRTVERAPWLVTLAPLALAWEAVGRWGGLPFVPPLSRVGTAALTLAARGELWASGARTLTAVLLGFALAAVAGTGLGVLMGRSRWVDAVAGLYVDLFQVTPAAAKVPVLILLVGLGPESILATVVLFSLFVVTVNVRAGVRAVPPRLVEMARSFGAGEAVLLRRVVLPAALPLILAGLRAGIGRAVNGAVLGEMLISIVGIGGLLMYYGGAFRMDVLGALILGIALLATALMGAVRAVERRVLRWTL